jgi:hypothetical protein
MADDLIRTDLDGLIGHVDDGETSAPEDMQSFLNFLVDLLRIDIIRRSWRTQQPLAALAIL